MKIDYSKYNMDFESGAAFKAIKDLIKFTKGKLPSDYLDFLRFSNGAFGTYLYIYPIDEVIDYSGTEWVKEDVPGFFVIGSNGGDEAYGYNLHLTPPEIFMIPFIGGRWENAVSFGTKFKEFLEKANNPTYLNTL